MPWTKSPPVTFCAEGTPVPRDRLPKGTARAAVPISPDGSSQWPEDRAHDGWSARMFVHQMLSTSRPPWTSSDTESLLSRSTLETSQVRVAGGSSASAALLAEPPTSPELYLTRPMLMALCRRAVKRRRRLQRVLLRTPAGWRRRTLTVTSRGEGYGFSLPTNAKVSRGSPEAGLMAFLARVVDG